MTSAPFEVLALSEDDKWRMKSAIDETLDSYPLVTICASDIGAQLRASGCSHSKLGEWARSVAARQVYTEHPGEDETLNAAMDWGTDLVLRYAEDEGAHLRCAEPI